MKSGNRISAVLSEDAVEKIIQKIEEIEALMPFLLTISADESRKLRNLGFDGVAFAQAGRDAVRASADFTRRSFDVDEFEKDLTLLEQLGRVRARLAPLSQQVAQTHQVTGADVMVAADDIYEDMGRDQGETAAIQAPYQQMRRRYTYRKTSADTDRRPQP